MFGRAWDEREANDIGACADRQRARGGGRKAVLAAIGNRLLFILFCFRPAPCRR